MRADKGDLLRAAALAERLRWGVPVRLLEMGERGSSRGDGSDDGALGRAEDVEAGTDDGRMTPPLHRSAD